MQTQAIGGADNFLDCQEVPASPISVTESNAFDRMQDYYFLVEADRLTSLMVYVRAFMIFPFISLAMNFRALFK